MTAKFDGFIAALKELCIEHQVVLSVDRGALLQVSDTSKEDGSDAGIDTHGYPIEDFTDGFEASALGKLGRL